VTFTGSTGVGKLLVRQSADNLQRTSMELGGNAPFLVFADADLDAAVEGAMAAKMRNGGEACTAANRFLVAREVAGEFTDRLTARMSALRCGHGLDEGTDVGPLITDRQRATVDRLVTDAVGRGARLRTGGQIPDGPGSFCPPTVLDQVPADAPILREEIFGPVATVTTFDDEDEAITSANDTEYGLVAYLFTRDLDRAIRVSSALNAGMVSINRGVVSDVAAPFGGVKSSGFGTRGRGRRHRGVPRRQVHRSLTSPRPG
jgi:succinate-semialdehyde dehydrogenase/glutarate-semialdehyde dehydrogenase